MFKRVIRGGLLLTLLLLVAGNLEAQSSVSFLPNGSLTGVTSTGTSTVFSTPILLPDGSAAAPPLAFSTQPGLGLGKAFTGMLGFTAGSAYIYTFDIAGMRINSGSYLGWGTSTPLAGSPDTTLYRDAANTLALRNSTAAQTFNIYNTYTDASNYERFELKYASNQMVFNSTAAGTGTTRAVYFAIGGTNQFYYAAGYFSPVSADTKDMGVNSTPWSNIFAARSIQGSKSKTLVDNTATAFVRLSVADDDYEGCGIIYTAYAEDTATDARQTRTGKVYAAILNNSGTEAVAFSTGDSAVSVTAGTFTCTFDGTSAATDTIDLRATCDTSLAATTTLTFEYRLDCPSTVTVTPQ